MFIVFDMVIWKISILTYGLSILPLTILPHACSSQTTRVALGFLFSGCQITHVIGEILGKNCREFFFFIFSKKCREKFPTD
jgi:hypothetical protein